MTPESQTLDQLITTYERIFRAYNEARKMLGHEHPTTLRLAADVLSAKTKLDDHQKKTLTPHQPELSLL